MGSYTFLSMYDRYPKTFRPQYFDASIDDRRKLEVRFRAMRNAKQFGLHNMMKTASLNFRECQKRVYTRQEEVKAHNHKLKQRHDDALENARKDGQTQRKAQLAASPPEYLSTAPKAEHTLDKDFEPADLQFIMSESGISAVVIADGFVRQLAVAAAIVVPCRPDDLGGYEEKLDVIMGNLEQNIGHEKR